MYRIKPLQWHGDIEDELDSMRADTPFGDYFIWLNYPGNPHEPKYICSYCFNKYYDEGDFYADTIKEAKKACQSHWEERLTQALTIATTKPETDE